MNGDSASYTIEDKNNQNLPPPYSANLGRVNPTFDVGSNDFIRKLNIFSIFWFLVLSARVIIFFRDQGTNTYEYVSNYSSMIR